MTRFLVILLVLLGATGAAGSYLAIEQYRTDLATPLGPNAARKTLVVAPGTPLREVAAEIQRRGLMARGYMLRVHARLNRQASLIKAGEYAIAPEMTPLDLLARMVAGDVVQHTLTVVEGWTFAQLLEAVRADTRLVQTLSGLDDRQIMARLGHVDDHPEGRFFADTYHFPRGTTDLRFLARAFDTMDRRLAAAWAARAEGLPYADPYEALIMASIIEKETGAAEERARIAGVFVRRLERNMLLQTDPTVIYGLGEGFDGDLRRRDLRQDTPYNTYVRKGLPPTPIALPGAAAIHAALHPEAGKALYFVSRGDGRHHFSETYAEHARAVRRYQTRAGRSNGG